MNITAQINNLEEHQMIWHGVCWWLYPDIMIALGDNNV